MPRPVQIAAALIGPLALAACVVPPPAGPSVMALPKQGEDFGRFQAQDANCRNYASAQIGNATPAQAATNSAVGSAVLGTAIGAAAGAALGSVGGAVGAGAAIGGATGLLVGSAAGANNAYASAGALQQGYNVAYTQCMYASGYTVQQPAYPARYLWIRVWFPGLCLWLPGLRVPLLSVLWLWVWPVHRSWRRLGLGWRLLRARRLLRTGWLLRRWRLARGWRRLAWRWRLPPLINRNSRRPLFT